MLIALRCHRIVNQGVLGDSYQNPNRAPCNPYRVNHDPNRDHLPIASCSCMQGDPNRTPDDPNRAKWCGSLYKVVWSEQIPHLTALQTQTHDPYHGGARGIKGSRVARGRTG